VGAAVADVGRFLVRGGFPEPFLAERDEDADRWRAQYLDGLVREDVLDFERIHDLRSLQLVIELLRDRVGTPVSYQSLASDVGVAPNTIRKYVSILEAIYVVFRVTPWSRDVARSLLKNPKLYFFDGGLVRGGNGPRFENLVAVCLLKHVLGEADRTGRDHRLHYIRTKDGREVDFCVVADGRPESLVEAKTGEADADRSLARFAAALGVRGVQVVRDLRREHRAGDVEVRAAGPFLRSLAL
jgi:predicted AAA+ superfamily ATPase